MAIARFELIDLNVLSFGINAFGEQQTTETKLFTTGSTVSAVANSLKMSEHYRLYQDMINFQLRYTPAMKDVVDNQDKYSITYRNKTWRIDNARESDDKMSVTLVCYRSDPVTAA